MSGLCANIQGDAVPLWLVGNFFHPWLIKQLLQHAQMWTTLRGTVGQGRMIAAVVDGFSSSVLLVDISFGLSWSVGGCVVAASVVASCGGR